MVRARISTVDVVDENLEDAAFHSRRLLHHLRQYTFVEKARHPPAPAPPGAKGDVLDLCVVLVDLSANTVGMVAALQGWLKRNRAGIELTVEIDGDRLQLSNPSPESEAALVQAWIDRHA